jgi:hypothetical protein
MRCFAIKYFASLEYIAEKKKKSFAIIKKERQKLKTLNYLELNTTLLIWRCQFNTKKGVKWKWQK